MDPIKKQKNVMKIVFTILTMVIIAFFAIAIIGKFVIKDDEGEITYLIFRNLGIFLAFATIVMAIFVKTAYKKNLDRASAALDLQMQNLNNSIKIVRLQIRSLQIELGESELMEEEFEPFTDMRSAQEEILRLNNVLQEYQIKQLKSKEIEDK